MNPSSGHVSYRIELWNLNINCLPSVWPGGVASILRRARAGGEPPGRRASGDDGAECDGVHRRVSRRHLRRPQLAVPHPLRPQAQRIPVPGAGLHHRRALEEAAHPVAASDRPELFATRAILTERNRDLCSRPRISMNAPPTLRHESRYLLSFIPAVDNMSYQCYFMAHQLRLSCSRRPW